MNIRLDGPAGSHIAWFPFDPVASGGWGSPQLALITGLLPHLRQFVRIRQALAQAEALGASLTALLDTPRIGVICLDQRGQIVAANDRARALLRQGDGLADRGGVLSARVPADRARLARLVAAALPPSRAPAVSGSMRLQRVAGRPPVVVHVKLPPWLYGSCIKSTTSRGSPDRWTWYGWCWRSPRAAGRLQQCPGAAGRADARGPHRSRPGGRDAGVDAAGEPDRGRAVLIGIPNSM